MEAARLDEEIESKQQDLAALEQLTERVYADRADFVAKNRRRLVKDAHRETNSARDRYLKLVDEIEQAAEMQSTTPGALTGRDALWAGSDEDLKRQKREKQRALERYESVWGPPRDVG